MQSNFPLTFNLPTTVYQNIQGLFTRQYIIYNMQHIIHNVAIDGNNVRLKNKIEYSSRYK